MKILIELSILGALCAPAAAFAAVPGAALEDLRGAAVSIADVPAVPAAEAAGNAQGARHGEYFPLDGEKVSLVYEHTSGGSGRTGTIRVELLNYSAKDNAVSLLKTVYEGGASHNEIYGAYADQHGVYSSNGLSGGKRMEFPLPAEAGRTWTRGSWQETIASLSAAIKVPAGDFRGCLKVTTRNGGEIGAERYYAPGVGLVYEKIFSGDSQGTFKLVSYKVR